MSRPQVVVIGGGAIGLSAAYQLAKKGAARVTLIEKDQLGDGASRRAAGIGTHLMWSETGVLARKLGFGLFRQFSAEWDDYTFHDEHGCLNLFTPESWPDRQPLLALYDRLDVKYEVLDAKEIRARWPALTPPDNYLALHDPLGGYSEPDEYVPALARRVRELGVEVLERSPVVEIMQRGGKVTGVRTPQRVIESDAVVSTVHVWSLPVWRDLGLRLPIKHFVHQRYVTAPLPRPFVAPPVNADPYHGYVRPATGGRLLMGIETEHREEHRVESIDFQMDALSTPDAVRDGGRAKMCELVPALDGIRWEDTRIGLISFAGDGEPILGPVQRFPGLFVAASFHSGGFSYNAVAGLLIAEHVLEGRTRIDTSVFSPDRFTPEETERHLAETVPQCRAVRRRH
jgi:sarcosine oxidase, subunit beta